MPTVGLAMELKRNLLISTFGKNFFNSARAASFKLPKRFRYRTEDVFKMRKVGGGMP